MCVCVCFVFLCESLCGEERGRGVEEFIIVMGLREEWLSREVTHHARRRLSPYSQARGLGWWLGLVCVCVCLCLWGCGGEIGQSAGGVIVLPDLQLEHRSPLSSSGP